jgi:hypothetical protein
MLLQDLLPLASRPGLEMWPPEARSLFSRVLRLEELVLL